MVLKRAGKLLRMGPVKKTAQIKLVQRLAEVNFNGNTQGTVSISDNDRNLTLQVVRGILNIVCISFYFFWDWTVFPGYFSFFRLNLTLEHK